MKQTKLSTREIAMSFRREHMNTAFPPEMTFDQVTKLLQIGRSTFYQMMADGELDSAKISVGTTPMFSRDRVLQCLFGRKPVVHESSTKLSPN